MENNRYQEALGMYRTPFYLFDLDAFQERIRQVKSLLGGTADVCYAMKANPFLTKAAADAADYLEVCSPGELCICERAEVPTEKIVFSGVNKRLEDIEQAMSVCGDKAIYTAESLQHVEFLQKAAFRYQLRPKVVLRLTSGNQFGMNESLLRQIVADRARYEPLTFIGIHYFSGTQKKRIKVFAEELQYLDNLIGELKTEFDFQTELLEYGTGLYVEYFPKVGENPQEQVLLGELKDCLEQMDYKGKITLEFGRYLAAFCGAYFTTIEDQKENGGIHYCIVDGGIHQVNYFGQMMGMKIPPFRHLCSSGEVCGTGDGETFHICGSLCTANDILVKNLPLENPKVGDILVFENTGAYSVNEGIAMLLSRNLPGVLCCDAKQGMRIVREHVETNRFHF